MCRSCSLNRTELEHGDVATVRILLTRTHHLQSLGHILLQCSTFAKSLDEIQQVVRLPGDLPCGKPARLFQGKGKPRPVEARQYQQSPSLSLETAGQQLQKARHGTEAGLLQRLERRIPAALRLVPRQRRWIEDHEPE